MTWYGCAARIAPFFSAARYTISPLFQRKLYMTDPFFLDMNGPIFTSLFKCAYFCKDIQLETKLYYLCVNFEYMQQTDHALLYTIKGQHLNMSTLCTIKYMNRPYFSKARYMIGVGFKILQNTGPHTSTKITTK